MDEPTRRSLHGVAELLIAGPQHRAHGTIRLRVTPGGFGGVAVPLRVEGTDLLWDGGRAPLAGTYRELAAAVGVVAGAPEGVYHDTTGIDPDTDISVDPAAAAEITGWFARGDAGLRAFAPDQEPVLWPEHFDLAITADEVNYGISPGDDAHPEPYAYVGPWTPREGPFWNAGFGALRPATDLPDAAAVAAFFAEGRSAAAS
ncbi:hypothetical protein [Pseudonocardia sp.]|uniref:hypothetical protein n=1 Tax=Pseudonocardia sp. TaxID=60912 RepID=UPI00262FC176|nr:hypothetical protein [Pseudonocardia sp.]